MSENGKVIDIKTKKRINSKKATMDAKRWQLLIRYLREGLMTVTIAGATLDKDEVGGLIEHLDSKIKADEKDQKRLANREKMKRWRAQNRNKND